jgi:hypothetical protein
MSPRTYYMQCVLWQHPYPNSLGFGQTLLDTQASRSLKQLPR